jgi:predicted O-methyltransferase YrrM
MTFLQQLRRRARIPVDLARELNRSTHELNHKMDALIEGSANESRILNDKSKAIIEGINNQTRMLGAKLDAVIAALNNQSRQLNLKLDAIVAAMDGGSSRPADATTDTPVQATNIVDAEPPSGALIAEKTYNTSHPDYDVAVVRNFPGKILNRELRCTNSAYTEMTKLANGDEVTDEAWAPVLQSALSEAKTAPHADLVLQRRDALEQHFAELGRRYNAQYMAGSVNFDDALFLYWLVRKLNPRTVVQCGVCNGLSSAFIMLALAKNGPDGRIFAIDLPPVFNPKDPEWTSAGRTYGIVIPEGKTSGWMVPEAYRKRFEVQNGDSKVLLPPLVDRLDTIDLFFHDSDHRYNHMMFEFHEAKRKLTPGGLIVADDISWNASLWDLADENKVPAYNFKGSIGAAFF